MAQMYTPEQLQALSLSQLQDIGKAMRIADYASWTTEVRAVTAILLAQTLATDPEPLQRAVLETMPLTQLRTVGKSLKIRGYSTWSTVQRAIDVIIGSGQTPSPDTQEPVRALAQVDIERANLKELKSIARTVGIRNLREYRAADMPRLQRLVLDEIAQAPGNAAAEVHVVDISQLQSRMSILLEDMRDLDVATQKSILLPAYEAYQQITQSLPPRARSPSPQRARSPSPQRARSPSPQRARSPSPPPRLPEFVEAQIVPFDELGQIVADMRDTDPVESQSGERDMQSAVEKCLMFL
jgi:hypothetical protein